MVENIYFYAKPEFLVCCLSKYGVLSGYHGMNDIYWAQWGYIFTFFFTLYSKQQLHRSRRRWPSITDL